MIFVTVGTQLPFPRLIDYMDAVSARLDEEVVAQTCAPVRTRYMRSFATCSADQMASFVQDARVIVAHAGIGTVLAARRAGRPLVLVPRQVTFGEHRNDHQMATASALNGRDGLRIAWDLAEVEPFLFSTLETPEGAPGPNYATLLETLRDFVAA